jgi:uncharacterized protein
MIEQTFCHIKGISTSFEKKLWECGILHWNDFFAKENELALSEKKRNAIKTELKSSQRALEQKDIGYFQEKLQASEHWRLSTMGRIGYVDIETTGLSKDFDQVTIIGIYDGKTPHLYVRGKNLNDAKEKLSAFDIVVSFNGKQFDIPFIEHLFSCRFSFLHLDLRYLMKELGFSGGLKSIERQLGIQREKEIGNIDGFEAVRLWHQYLRGSSEALQKLLKYNAQDTISLQELLEYYVTNKKKQFGF